jgi:hypothetical protein
MGECRAIQWEEAGNQISKYQTSLERLGLHACKNLGSREMLDSDFILAVLGQPQQRQ